MLNPGFTTEADRAYGSSYVVPDQVTKAIVRGSIDCLVRIGDGRVVVVELKTGTRRPEHEAQLALYVDAARALFPGRAVEGLLVYAT